MLILPRRFREQKEPHLLHYPAAILEAKYKVQICRNHEYVISEPLGPGFHKNLITNVGLDFVMQNGQSLSSLLTSGCRVGSGTNPPTITDTALQTGLKGTQNVFTGGGIQAVNDTVNGAVAFTNVYEFAAEVGSVTYNELGLCTVNTPTGGVQLTRALFGSPISLTSGQNLRLTYALNVSCPAAVTSIPVSLAAVNGFNISGNMRLCGFFNATFGSATTSGISGANDAIWRCAAVAASSHAANFQSAPTTFPAVNASLAGTVIASGGIAATSQSTYTNGSFTRNCTYVWSPSTPPSTVSNIAGILFSNSTSATTLGVYLLLSSAQTKANTNTLTVTFSSSVARA